MDPSRIWSSACSRVPSNLLSAGLMRASRSLQSTPERTQGYPQETETQVPRHQNFIPQWSTTVPLPSRSPPRAGLLLTPMDSVLQWRCKASRSLDPYLGRSSWPGAKDSGHWFPMKANGWSSSQQACSHPHLFPGRMQTSAPPRPRGLLGRASASHGPWCTSPRPRQVLCVELRQGAQVFQTKAPLASWKLQNKGLCLSPPCPALPAWPPFFLSFFKNFIVV